MHCVPSVCVCVFEMKECVAKRLHFLYVYFFVIETDNAACIISMMILFQIL